MKIKIQISKKKKKNGIKIEKQMQKTNKKNALIEQNLRKVLEQKNKEKQEKKKN